MVYGSARQSYIKQLDTTHNQGLRLCLGAFRTSPVQFVCGDEWAIIGHEEDRRSLQYCAKLKSDEVNPACSSVFLYNYVATYEAKENWD